MSKGELTERDRKMVENRIHRLHGEMSVVKLWGKSAVQTKELNRLFTIKARLKGWLNEKYV